MAAVVTNVLVYFLINVCLFLSFFFLVIKALTIVVYDFTMFAVWNTDLNTWIAGSHGFAYSSMRATGNPSAAILLQSKHWIDTLTYAHVSAWNATGDRFLASNFMKILGKKMEKFPRSSRLLNIYWKLLKKFADVN